MKKTNVAGIGSLIAGACLYGFHEMSGFMGKAGNLNAYDNAKDAGAHATLYTILPEGNFDWIDSIPWGKVREGVDYVVHMPAWLLLVIVGAVLLIVGGIFIKR